MLEQQEPDHQLPVFRRPAGVWRKSPAIFDLEIVPRNQLFDPQPAVVLVELPAERKKLRKKKLGFPVFGSVHGQALLRKLHAFWGIDAKIRVFRTCNLPAKYHRTFLISKYYGGKRTFSADPK
jgi:hypothetical protein